MVEHNDTTIGKLEVGSGKWQKWKSKVMIKTTSLRHPILDFGGFFKN